MEGYSTMSLLEQLGSMSTEIKTILSIIAISLPSLPIFLVLKLFNTKKDYGIVDRMIAFSFGTLFGDALFEVLPIIIELVKDDHHMIHECTIYIVAGFMLIYITDQVLHIIKNNRRTQSKSYKSKQITNSDQASDNNAIIFLLGDLIHNVQDGITIGAAYLISDKVGITTTFAIFMHEIPHELGDFAQLFKYNYSLSQIMLSQIGTASGAIIGGLIGCQLGAAYKVELMSAALGMFIYGSACIVLPEIKNEIKTFTRLIDSLFHMLIGFMVMFYCCGC